MKMTNKQNYVIIIVVTIVAFVETTPWIPTPRNDSYFINRHHLLLNKTATYAAEEKVIFLGASIVERWLQHGLPLWEKYYVPRHAYNYGLSSDKTENVLWRIEEGGELNGLVNGTARLVVLFVGSNNRHDKPADVVHGLRAINQALLKKLPSVRIILLSIFPRSEDAHQVGEINKLLEHEGDNKSVFFLDVTKHFETSPGHLNTSLYQLDHLHLTLAGYQVWYEAMEPLFSKLLTK